VTLVNADPGQDGPVRFRITCEERGKAGTTSIIRCERVLAVAAMTMMSLSRTFTQSNWISEAAMASKGRISGVATCRSRFTASGVKTWIFFIVAVQGASLRSRIHRDQLCRPPIKDLDRI
jgi:hypothetical protein